MVQIAAEIPDSFSVYKDQKSTNEESENWL